MIQVREPINDHEINDPEVQSTKRWRTMLVGSVVVDTTVLIGAHVYNREHQDDNMPTPDEDRVTITEYETEDL